MGAGDDRRSGGEPRDEARKGAPLVNRYRRPGGWSGTTGCEGGDVEEEGVTHLWPEGYKVEVEADKRGVPLCLRWEGVVHPVERVAARWRIDEE
jgi:hypothetical protein